MSLERTTRISGPQSVVAKVHHQDSGDIVVILSSSMGQKIHVTTAYNVSRIDLLRFFQEIVDTIHLPTPKDNI